MTKEQELMHFLHEKVFDPILSNPKASGKTKSGVNLTIARMNRLSAEKMVQYFWSALATENAVNFSKHLEEEGFVRFEDVTDEFRDKFNDTWISK